MFLYRSYYENHMLLSKFTNFQKLLFVISMGITLGWINDYFFRAYCAITIMEYGGMPDYEPNFMLIFVITILLMTGGALTGAGLWILKKWLGNYYGPISLKPVLDGELFERKMPLPFIDRFVLGTTLLFLICLISLASERFF